jgi:hypothetical protein
MPHVSVSRRKKNALFPEPVLTENPIVGYFWQ